MNRTKARIAYIDRKIGTQAADEERRTHVRSVMNRLAELSTHLQSQLNDADWATKREIIRALVQRIEIGPTKVAVVLRLPTGTSSRALEPIMGDSVPSVRPTSSICRRLLPGLPVAQRRFVNCRHLQPLS
jgi:hypothetical protein